MTEISAILAALAAAPGEPAALATLVEVQGSSYRRPGARLLLLAGGHRLGSVSGGCLEEDVVLRARQVLETGRPDTTVYDTTQENDIVWGVGLGCQGIVRVFLEPIPVARPFWLSVLAENLASGRPTELSIVHGGVAAARQGTHLSDDVAIPADTAGVFQEIVLPPPSLVLCGAGDDVQPLVRLAREVGWRVTVVDSRAAYATRARFPEADAVVVAPPGETPARLALGEESFVVVMTHRYAEDLKLLQGLLARPLAYLGVLGPRKRTERLLGELRRDGLAVDSEALGRLHAPVGLDLGSTTPGAIALSILAEIQGCAAGRKPISLRDRTAPIHG